MSTLRIVVKYPDVDNLDDGPGESLIPENHRDGWRKLVSHYPLLTIDRLFNNRHTRQAIEELRKIARKRARAQDSRYQPPRFDNYLLVAGLRWTDQWQLVVDTIASWEGIEACYLRLDDHNPSGLLPATPPLDFNGGKDPKYKKRQDHLWADRNGLVVTHNGLGAEKIWKSFAGAAGELQDFVDIERAWDLTHPDLALGNAGGIATLSLKNALPVVQSMDPQEKAHGTSVLGIVCAAHNQVGMIGFAPYLASATVIPYADGIPSSVAALDAVALQLDKAIKCGVDAYPDRGIGTVILIEAHTQVWDKASNKISNYFYPVEVYPDTFAAIQFAVALGITVIEPAGNGAQKPVAGEALDVDLDVLEDANGNYWQKLGILDSRQAPSTSGHSGAIMVAAARTALEKKRSVIPTWSKLDYSNYGGRIDCFASGQDVSTLDDPAAGDGYTDVFDGTSSASAIIAGAALCLQGVYQANFTWPMNPAAVRAALRDSGSGTKSAAWPLDKIGVMPYLPHVIANHVKKAA